MKTFIGKKQTIGYPKTDKELLPCPHCGGKASLKVEISVAAHVSCKDCGAKIEAETKEAAVETWNRRA